MTGGAGFIGSHLAEELLKRGHRVVILDDLSTAELDNIAHLLNLSNPLANQRSLISVEMVTTQLR